MSAPWKELISARPIKVVQAFDDQGSWNTSHSNSMVTYEIDSDSTVMLYIEDSWLTIHDLREIRNFLDELIDDVKSREIQD